MITIEQILGSIGIDFEHDGVQFRLVPFTNAEVTEWNRVLFGDRPSDVSALEHTENVQKKQLEQITKQMRACVTNGDKKKVTSSWVGKNFPQTILQDLAEFFANGKRPEWAGETGN